MKKPVSKKIPVRKHIKCKKSLWKKYIGDKNTTNWFKYTQQRNKVKETIRNDIKEQQNAIAQQYKTNPKKIGNTSTLRPNVSKNR